jgi:hypothetical protein
VRALPWRGGRATSLAATAATRLDCHSAPSRTRTTANHEEHEDMSTTRFHETLRIGRSVAALAAVALLAAAPAQAAGTTSAVCAGAFKASVSPGFSLTPSSGTVTTNGEVRSLTCAGRIDGQRVTGAGTVGADYVYAPGSTCLSHAGSGTVRLTLPTAAGTKHMVGALTVHRAALVLSIDAQFPTARFNGIGVVLPLAGSCLFTPWRRALVSVTGLLTGA